MPGRRRRFGSISPSECEHSLSVLPLLPVATLKSTIYQLLKELPPPPGLRSEVWRVSSLPLPFIFRVQMRWKQMVSPRGEQKWPLRDSAAPTPGFDGAGGVGVIHGHSPYSRLQRKERFLIKVFVSVCFRNTQSLWIHFPPCESTWFCKWIPDLFCCQNSPLLVSYTSFWKTEVQARFKKKSQVLTLIKQC